jgi:hypothetical protein
LRGTGRRHRWRIDHHGANPDAEEKPLPVGVTGALDLRPTGMLGVSAETFVAAFFGRWLRGRPSPVLDGPSPNFPDVTFVP